MTKSISYTGGSWTSQKSAISNLLSGIAGEHRRSDCNCVFTEFAGDDLSGFEAGLKSSAAGLLDYRIQGRLSCIHNATTEDNSLNIQQIDDTCYARTNIFPGAFDHH